MKGTIRDAACNVDSVDTCTLQTETRHRWAAKNKLAPGKGEDGPTLELDGEDFCLAWSRW